MQKMSILFVALALVLVGGAGFAYYRMQNPGGMMVEETMIEDTMLAGDEYVQDDSLVGGDAMMEPGTMYTIAEQNGSGVSGTATMLETADGQVEVTLVMDGASDTVEHPAHIHSGVCPNPGEIVYPLENIVGGTSVTLLDASLAEVMAAAETLAINIHESSENLSNYVACGDLQ